MSTPALEANFLIAVGGASSRFVVDVELDLPSGILVLFGPTGAGKSLTVKALAGLVTPARGWIRVGGETLFDAEHPGIDVPAHRRRVGYVPQQQALFPGLNVAENVAFGLLLSRAERRGGSARVAELLDELGLAALAGASVERLSGGERQRVALARALAVEPRLLLLDEPFASIDHDGRAALGGVLREALSRRGTAAVLVTHDVQEASRLGDRVTRFTRGKTIASGTPNEVLSLPGRLVVRGELAGAPRSLGEGRSAATLRECVVEGPTEILASDASDLSIEADNARTPR